MSIHADPLFVTAEVERRLELAGVDVHSRHHHPAPEPSAAPVAVALHPLAAVLTRLVRPRPAGRPRHP
ncbi:hypothetical protein [Phycicoccus avicenniae]|uniref:hypothetical protein n=1 Tax=Phycicoccus avicenniae TaxID=2828860 RepID=UPI003D2A5CA2